MDSLHKNSFYRPLNNTYGQNLWYAWYCKNYAGYAVICM